jgi:hypothetical protein
MRMRWLWVPATLFIWESSSARRSGFSRSLTVEPDDLANRYNLSASLLQLNETEQALDLLEGCIEKMPASRIDRIMRDPDLVSLHDHPRFQALD